MSAFISAILALSFLVCSGEIIKSAEPGPSPNLSQIIDGQRNTDASVDTKSPSMTEDIWGGIGGLHMTKNEILTKNNIQKVDHKKKYLIAAEQ